jgi:hypothetical protein
MKDKKTLCMSELVEYIMLSRKNGTTICEIDDVFVKLIQNQPPSESDKIWLFLLGFIQGKDLNLAMSLDSKQLLVEKFKSMNLLNAHSLLIERREQ